MIRKVLAVLRWGKNQEEIRAEVRKEPEVIKAEKALDRFYASIRAAEKGLISSQPERRKSPR